MADPGPYLEAPLHWDQVHPQVELLVHFQGREGS